MGEGALYTKCRSLIHIRNAGMWKDGPSRKHSSETQMHLLEEDSEMEGSRASLLEWGEGRGTRGENSKGKMGMIAP